MEVVEEREEMVEPRVSFHSEEERHMSRKLPFEDPAKLHEAGSTPSRMVRYHSENEKESSRGGSSSESGEDDVIIAEHTGTGESIDQVEKKNMKKTSFMNCAQQALAALEEPEVVVQTVEETKV